MRGQFNREEVSHNNRHGLPVIVDIAYRRKVNRNLSNNTGGENIRQ